MADGDTMTAQPVAPHDAYASVAAAIAALDRGDTEAALLAASAACFAAPEAAETHYVYGDAWAAKGDHARAEHAFAAALTRSPTWADAWVSYGVARYRQGALGDAVTAMRQALRNAPGHAAAIANLGAFLSITGGGEQAEALLVRAVARDPAGPGARMNLAVDLLGDERAEEALALLDEAEVPAEADVARHWHLQRFAALLQLGRAPEARSALDAFDALGPVPPALRPLRLWRSLLLARRDGDVAAVEAAASAMAEALDAMGPDAVPEHRILGHYQLAGFRDRRGEAAGAFAHWTMAHRLLAVSQPFSRADHLAFCDANRRTFTATRFAEGPRAANVDPTPVFIVGMPRSGTTLCEQILAAHRDVHGAGERTALGDAFRGLGGPRDDAAGPARIAALGQVQLDAAADRYLAELHALAPEATRVVDKMPGNLLHLGLVGLMLPGARIIHCTRDPRDIGLSIFARRFHGWHGYAHDLSDLGWTIAEHGRLMEHWKTHLPNPVLTVALTDWIDDFDATLARVLDHLSLPPRPELRAVPREQGPGQDGEPHAGARAHQCPRRGALAPLCRRAGPAHRDAGRTQGLTGRTQIVDHRSGLQETPPCPLPPSSRLPTPTA